MFNDTPAQKNNKNRSAIGCQINQYMCMYVWARAVLKLLLQLLLLLLLLLLLFIIIIIGD